MAAIIEIQPGLRATVQDGVWQCDDADWLGLFEALSQDVGSPSIPDLDEHLAQLMVDQFKLDWVRHSDRPPSDDPPGTIY